MKAELAAAAGARVNTTLRLRRHTTSHYLPMEFPLRFKGSNVFCRFLTRLSQMEILIANYEVADRPLDEEKLRVSTNSGLTNSHFFFQNSKYSVNEYLPPYLESRWCQKGRDALCLWEIRKYRLG